MDLTQKRARAAAARRVIDTARRMHVWLGALTPPLERGDSKHRPGFELYCEMTRALNELDELLPTREPHADDK